MSNFLAIATVTEVLRSLLDEATAGAVPEFQVSVGIERPDEIAEDGQGHVSIFLYQVLPNVSLRNQNMPTRSSDGSLVRTPQAALNLRYLLSFTGDAGRQVGERLLGASVTALEARAVLDRERIREVIQTQQAIKPFLAASDLADAVQLVKLTPLPLELDDLSKLWSIFFQVPYALSVVYEASVVVLEPASASPQRALPVRGPTPPDGRDGRNLYVVPFRSPVIEELDPPVAAVGDTLVLRGRGLRGELTNVTVGGLPLSPAPGDPGENEIELQLTTPPVPAAALRPGIVGVQVVHRRLLGTPPTPHDGIESNVLPLVLRPTVVSANVDNVQVTPDDTRSADIELELAPPVGKRQRVVLLLNELVTTSPPAPPATRPARAYSFEAPSRDLESEPESAAQLTIPVLRVRPDDYLLRVQVDGADSLVTLGALPATPGIQQYVEPRITIP